MATFDLAPAVIDALRDPRVGAELQAMIRKAVADAVTYATSSGAPKFERPEDFARRYKISARTVRNWLRLGLPHVKQGRAVRIDTDRADAWLADDVHGREIEARAREDAVKARAIRRAG